MPYIIYFCSSHFFGFVKTLWRVILWVSKEQRRTKTTLDWHSSIRSLFLGFLWSKLLCIGVSVGYVEPVSVLTSPRTLTLLWWSCCFGDQTDLHLYNSRFHFSSSSKSRDCLPVKRTNHGLTPWFKVTYEVTTFTATFSSFVGPDCAHFIVRIVFYRQISPEDTLKSPYCNYCSQCAQVEATSDTLKNKTTGNQHPWKHCRFWL